MPCKPSSPPVNGACSQRKYLRQRQRNHREVDPLAADRQQAHHQADQRPGRGAGQQPQLGRQTEIAQRVSRDITGRAEERRMAERQQAGIADQQIECAGEQRKAQHLHQEYRIQHKRRGQQRDQYHSVRDFLVHVDAPLKNL
jgi:hypothetical protein